MGVSVPRSLDELVAVLAERPESELLAGGTDFVVEVNFGRRHPDSVISVARVPELAGWHREQDETGAGLVLGAGLTYTEMMEPELAGLLPCLAQAARTVGSPQIRNAGTLGGNLATASPAGDSLPVLAALGARVRLASRDSQRELTLAELVIGPKRTSLLPGEVILSVRVPLSSTRQEFLKVGTRNAMVIAICSVALVVDDTAREVRVGLGSVGPVPLRAPDAEQLAASRIDWETGNWQGSDADLEAFGALVGAAARPIDDHRSTVAYRRRAVAVCARRALERVTGHRAMTSSEGAPGR
ncbi:MAG: FAD binding domain-containing protein [Acidimicrobiales bacterium]